MKMSRLESAIRAVLEFNKAFNRHDIAGMVKLLSEDCVFENADPAPDGATYSGKEAIARYWQDIFLNSPHVHVEIEEVFGLGDRCVMRWKCDWVDGAGKADHVRGVDVFLVKDGSICQQLSYVKG